MKGMKQVAGAMKGELAQYREMAAFAKFGSDLDASTQRLLGRGARLTELLKQNQFSPVPVEEQIVLIYAGTRGYLDKLAVEDVRRYEGELVAWLRNKKSSLLTSIRDKKDIKADGIEDKIKASLDEFAGVFA
jgi:F-type H+-transporting ATPase subunit alpha